VGLIKRLLSQEEGTIQLLFQRLPQQGIFGSEFGSQVIPIFVDYMVKGANRVQWHIPCPQLLTVGFEFITNQANACRLEFHDSADHVVIVF